MTLEIVYRLGEGNTVPYGPIFDGVRSNRGFTDTRRRPDLAAEIAEGKNSDALRDLLIDVASHDRYVSLGCDLGEHQEANAPTARRSVAGGYVQLCGFNYELQETAGCDNFCRALAATLKPRAKGVFWRVEFVGTWVAFKFPGEEPVTKSSIWVWFFAAERTPEEAVASREKLLNVLSDSLNQRSVYAKLRRTD